ncbi:MAG: hypothetical protein ISR96_06210 [Nitrospira sp.]|nr:hypothetical protein [bacterium]MBL7049089.1 hypothetical protein [Nitrospira sp.]
MRVKSLIAALIISLALITSGAEAMPLLTGSSSDGLTWTASDSNGRAARAVFRDTSTGFNITLTSEASATHVPNEVLGGIFFDFNGAISNPHVTANISDIFYPNNITLTYGSNLDGEWAYRAGVDSINGGLGDYVLSNTSFDPQSGAPAGWDGLGVDDIIDITKYYKPQ